MSWTKIFENPIGNPRGYQPGESVEQAYQRLLTEFDDDMASAEAAERDGREEEARELRKGARMAMRMADQLRDSVDAGRRTWSERYP